jgi:hypothetical protein
MFQDGLPASSVIAGSGGNCYILTSPNEHNQGLLEGVGQSAINYIVFLNPA